MPALPLSTYLRLARASAAYDVNQILLLATPWTFALLLDRLPPFAPLYILLVPGLLRGVAQWWPVAQASGSSTPRAAFTSAVPMRSSRGG
jgi:hypothetical protein